MTIRARRLFTSSIALAALATPAVAVGQAAKVPAPKASAATKAPTPKAAPSDAAVKRVRDGSTAPPKPVVDPEAARKLEALLQKWEARSAAVKALSVKYTRVDDSPLFDVKKTFQGQAKLKSPDLVYLDFYEVVDGKATGAFSERIVCDGQNVYQFLGPQKKVFVYPLEQDPRKKALNQGPLPFLFGMSVAKAKQRYDMEFVGENKDVYAIQIYPKLPIDAEEYSKAWVKLSKATLLPQEIRLWSPNGKETKRFTFAPEALVENADVGAGWFDGRKMVADQVKLKWGVVVNPGPDGQPQGAPAVTGRVGAGGGANMKVEKVEAKGARPRPR